MSTVPAVQLAPRHRSRRSVENTPALTATVEATPNAVADLRIVYRNPAELKFHPKRARKHPEKKITQLAASTKQFGLNSPLLIDPSDTILAGHARLLAAQELGLERVPTICLSHFRSAEEARAYMLADNKLPLLSEWDKEVLRSELLDLSAAELNFSIEVTGFETAEIDLIIEDVNGEASEADSADALPELRTEAVTRAGDVWHFGRNVLLCGDARHAESYEKILGREKARLAIVDVPYNCRIQGHVSGLGRRKHREFAMASGEMSKAEFIAFLTTVFGHLAAYSVDGSLHYLWMDHHHMDEILAAGGAVYTERKNLLVWQKASGGMGSLYRSQHELIFLYKNGSAPHVNNVQLGAHGRYRTNILTYPGGSSFHAGRDEELGFHPTVKPVALIADLIRDASSINDLVLDCCVGSGTIYLAAEKTRRRAAGMEIDATYCDVSIERWQAFTGDSAVLAETGETFAQVAERRANEQKLAAAAGAEVHHG